MRKQFMENNTGEVFVELGRAHFNQNGGCTGVRPVDGEMLLERGE